MNAATYYAELIAWILSHVTDADMFLVQSAVTCCALFWLLHRAWLTLWKPVPELISILGVEVPDPPAVSLAGIRADAVTLHWTRPGANKPVIKYLIQVNGVNVGDSSRTETAITVTGLKPGHFYNVRVIAVGSNNFQAGSAVLRLRTYGRDGRPQFANGRMPSNLSIEEQQNGGLTESSDEASSLRTQAAGVESAFVEGIQITREPGSVLAGQRRNTARRHSPSNATSDQSVFARQRSNQPGESMQQLTARFEAIRKETDDLVEQVSKDAEDFKIQILALMREKDDKKQLLKEKEEASEKLKKEVNYSEKANRQAQNRKSQKEKILRDKQAERTRMHEDMARWRSEIETMKTQRAVWQQEKESMLIERASKVEELRKTIGERQSSLNGLEEEIRVKGLQIKELEEERKKQPGGEDNEESRERDAAAARSDLEWETRERELMTQLNKQNMRLRQLQAEYHQYQNQYNVLGARHNSVAYPASASGVDFDPSGQGIAKSRRSRNRKSRTSTLSSPVSGYGVTDSPYSDAGQYVDNFPPAFAPGPYFDLSNDTAMVPMSEQMGEMSDADVRALTAGAPLSPTATSLLPSNIFADDDPPSPQAGSMRSLGAALYGPGLDPEPQSPHSSSRSPSLMSSPQASSQNLSMYGVAGPELVADNDRQSIGSPRPAFGAVGSSGAPDLATSQRNFGSLFSRNRGKKMQGDGPALGSLKQGQSHSFPRSAEEPEHTTTRSRRISLSSTFSAVPGLFRSATTGEVIEGNGPAPARNAGARKRRGFAMFGSSDDPTSMLPDRGPSSPRPVSIASSDLPRPSTDSAPFGWPAPAETHAVSRSSHLATDWSLNPSVVGPSWSTNPSRRPSVQHGSAIALASGIAREDDDYLPMDTIAGQSSPPPAGVIGGPRPISSHRQITPKLNPAAPTFKAPMSLFSRSSKAEKYKANENFVDAEASIDESHLVANFSPAEPRKSRDTPSIRTQNSIGESFESLENSSSYTPSEVANLSATSAKSESSIKNLFRKGSSSKFNLFNGRKGGSSAANSDRNASSERDGEDHGEDTLGRSLDSVTSSPMLGGHTSDRESVTTPKEGRRSWRFGLKKDKKGRESLDVGSRSEAETTGTEDENGF